MEDPVIMDAGEFDPDFPKAAEAPESLLDLSQESAESTNSYDEQVDNSPTSPRGDAPDSSSDVVPESPTDQVPESPMDQVPESPTDQVPESPTDQVPESPTDQVPESPVDNVPNSPFEANDMMGHVEQENNVSQEDVTDEHDVQGKGEETDEPVHSGQDDVSAPEDDSVTHDPVLAQISVESSNPEEAGPRDAEDEREVFDEVESKTEENAPESPSEKEPESPAIVPDPEPQTYETHETQTVQGPDKSAKIKELEAKVAELESTLKSKDDKINTLQSEVERLNTEIKSRSVPDTKRKTPSGSSDPRSKSVGAKKAGTRPTSGARAASKPTPVSNGVSKRPAGSPMKRPGTAGSRPKSGATKTTGPPKSTGGKAAAGKKAGKGGNRVDMTKGIDGEEHAVKLMLRGRGIVCYPPTDFTMEGINSEKPEETLKINWVYGYRGRDSQDNIFCLPSNELLYYQAALGVIYNPTTRTQRFYQGHNDDIKCIALNPANPNLVATGQAAGHDEKEGDPHVRVWDCETFETLAVLGLGNLQRGVGSVAFSPDGNKVLAVDEGNDHTIYVYDLKKKAAIASQKGHQDPVLGVEYIPGSNSKFITYGKGHIIYWEQDGSKLVKKSGLFEKHPKPRFITSLAFTEKGEPITGDSNGNLFLWNPNERKISKSKVGAHEGSIYSIAVRGNEIYTGGQDCKVKKFSATDLSPDDVWELDSATHGRVKAITFVGDDLAVGTYNNGMLFGKFGDEPQQIIYGHGAGDLWGGANHPNENTFATVGQDKVVYIWDAESHTPKNIFRVEKPAQACCFSPDGSVLAVASTTGEWFVLDSNDGSVLSSYKSGPEQIDAISYSPDGSSIAVGSHDNFVYLFECEDLRSEYKQIGKCTGHSSFITHLDFSDDGKVLQTTSGDYEHLFWDATNGDQITSSKDMRDVNMFTYTCTLGFPVCGIWPVGYDGTDINALCRSHDDKLLVTADDFGLVNLFRYPCCNPTAEWSSFRGHSAHVTKVRFLTGNKEIFSLGGRDQSIIQWGVC